MNENKMNFDMNVGERLKVSKGYVEVYQVDGGVRDYSLDGNLLSRFSKEQMENRSQPNFICMENCILTQKDNYWYALTYMGAKICEFETTELKVYKNYVVIKNDKEMRLYDTEKRKYVGKTFDKIWRWDELFVLKKGEKHYLYNVESKKIEEKFQICIFAEHKKGKNFIFLYYKDKCGLLIAEKYNKRFSRVLPIEYQKIKIKDDEIIAIKNGKKEYYPLKESYCKEKNNYADTNNKNDYKINFLNSIQVLFGEELVLKEKFILLIGDLEEKRPCKYYNLRGKYIGWSGIIRDDSGYFCGENYIATENMLALGGDSSIPFGRNEDWKLYDYAGNDLFGGRRFEFEQSRKYYLGKPVSGAENITYVFSNKGKLLFTLDNSKKILEVADKYFKILDNENKVWFFDDKGKTIFDKGIEKDMLMNLYNGFVCERIKNGYNVYDCNHGKLNYIKADSLENMDIVCKLNIFRVTYEEKHGVILLNSKGYKIIVPVEYLEVQKYEDIILAKAEEWDDIYDFDGTLIMSTK